MASGEKAAGGTNPEDHTNANKTEDNLPPLCLVLVGPAGVGKSTFGNATLGLLETAVGSNQGFVMSNRHIAICTTSAEKRQGPWLGQKGNERIEVIDLPGYHGERHENTEKHRTSITDGVKDERLVHAFIFLKTADHPALDDEDRLVLQKLQGFFGSRFFGHLVIVVTGWFSSSEKGGKERKREIQKKIKKSMSGQDYHDIPIFFIDALHDKDQREDVEQYEKSMELLWEAIRACSEQPLKNSEILKDDFSKLHITAVRDLEQKVAHLEEHIQVLRSALVYPMEAHNTGAADWNQPMDAAVVGELANPSPPEIDQATPDAHAAEIIPPPITSPSLQTSLDTTGGNSSEPGYQSTARPAQLKISCMSTSSHKRGPGRHTALYNITREKTEVIAASHSSASAKSTKSTRSAILNSPVSLEQKKCEKRREPGRRDHITERGGDEKQSPHFRTKAKSSSGLQ